MSRGTVLQSECQDFQSFLEGCTKIERKKFTAHYAARKNGCQQFLQRRVFGNLKLGVLRGWMRLYELVVNGEPHSTKRTSAAEAAMRRRPLWHGDPRLKPRTTSHAPFDKAEDFNRFLYLMWLVGGGSYGRFWKYKSSVLTGVWRFLLRFGG
jgi:hypothetical protein